MNRLKIGLGLALASLILYGVFKIIMHFYQDKCSDYQCPDGYVKNESKKDTECDSLTCDSNDKDTCCNKSVNCEGSWSGFGVCSVECGGGTQTRTYTITTQPQYGGTPCPTSHGSQDSQPCNTQACAICSSFQCPRDYNPRSEAVNESCGKTQCDNSNIDLCCETIQGGNDATEGDNDAAGDGDTGVVNVPNATCSTVRCPDGYYYKAYLADTACAGPTCDVEIGGVDLNTCCLKFNCTDPFAQGNPPVGYVADENVGLVTFAGGSVAGVRCDTENGYYLPYFNIITATCGDDIDGQPPNYILSGCEQGCTSPGSLPTGYTGNLPATLPVGVGDITGVNCSDNYHGTPQYNCNGVGEEYILDGCGQPIDCVVTSTQYSLCSGDCGSRGTKTATYAIGVEAQYGGTPCPTTEEIPCDTRACATCSSYQCPEDYIPKSGVAEVSCGNYDCNIDNRDTCCEVGQLPEEQDTELPFCSEVVQPDKLPSTTFASTYVDNLQGCSEICNIMPICQSFGYSETGRGDINCFLGSSITTRDPQGFNARDIFSWSFYPKCQH